MLDYAVKTMCFDAACTKQLFSGHYYSIVLVTRGTARFHWEAERWICSTEDLFLFKPGEGTVMVFPGGKIPLEMLWVQLSPEALAALSDEATQLEESLLKMFVILVLRACIHAEQHRAQGSRKHLMMDELFVYIRTHITEEITLEQLEQVFYISRFHIAREFKRQTGQTLHSYIVKTKLDLCCHYIEQGRPITEVYRLGGFGGYNHFFRAFKQEYGMTPKQYFRSVQKDAHA